MWTSYTQLPNYKVSYVLAINVRDGYKLSLEELGHPAGTMLVAVEANTSSVMLTVGDAQPLPISPCGQWDFQVFTLSPVVQGWALLGEPDKWVSVSEARFSDLVFDDQVRELDKEERWRILERKR